MTTIDHLLKLRQARQEAEDTLKARYSFEARIAYDNAARAFEYALSVAAEDLLKMAECAGQSHDAALLAAEALRVEFDPDKVATDGGEIADWLQQRANDAKEAGNG